MMDASGEKGKTWRSDVKDAARKVYCGLPTTSPVIISMEFVMERPKCHFGSGKNSSVLKSSSPTCHIYKPDVLKLSRAVEDALTGIIWKDDSQIWSETLVKRYGPCAGVEVLIDIED